MIIAEKKLFCYLTISVGAAAIAFNYIESWFGVFLPPFGEGLFNGLFKNWYGLGA
jgi:hypothetical protein